MLPQPDTVDEPVRLAETGVGYVPHRLDPYRHDGLIRRITPFAAAVALAFVLLPLQRVDVDVELLAVAAGMLLMVGGLLFVYEWAPRTVQQVAVPVLPAAYLIAIGFMRDATGDPGTGYGALMYLAPFWAALHGTRKQVLLVTALLFLAQAGLFQAHVDIVSLRRALLSALVIGIISLVVQRQVMALLTAWKRLTQLDREREATVLELESVNEALERSNRELRQFANVSTHDLQEPLRMIRSFSQLFMQRHGQALDADAAELLGFVVDGAERAQALVQDLLDYSEVGMTDPAFTDVDLEDVLTQALFVLSASIEEHGATIERSGDLPTIRGDEAKLVRLFINLISNAIKYHHPDRAPVIAILGRSLDEQRWRIDVVDNGIGFDPQHRERIFGMFQRLHARGEYPGTGIGLAICDRIAEQHGATMLADGTPGRGARFSILFGGR